MKRIIDLTVDMKTKKYDEVLLKQMDTTILNIEVLEDSRTIDLTNQTAYVIFTKPNKTIVQQTATISNGIISVELMPDCVRDYGKGTIEVELKDGTTNVYCSFYVPVKIEQTSKGRATSDNTLNYFEELENEIHNVKKGDTGTSITTIQQTSTSQEDGGTNIITVSKDDGTSSTFTVLNGKKGSKGDTGTGITTIQQTTTSQEDGGTNIITVSKDDGTSSTFAVLNGRKGNKGDKGDNNILSIGTVESGAQASATITGNSPSQILNLVIPKGDKGDTGEQGVSPTISISKNGKVTTVTITDANGTQTFEINDGADGAGSGDMQASVYDTNNNGIVDNAERVNNHTVESNVPANAVFTDTTYTNVSEFTNDAGYLTAHQDITGKENNSNKVTSINSNSTNTQYPSALAVYNLFNSIVNGDGVSY